MKKSHNIIRVHPPEISPEERARCLEAIRQAAVRLVIETARSKGRDEK